MSRLSSTYPVSDKQDSSRVDQWEAMCSSMDIGQDVPVGSRVKGYKWMILDMKEFIVSR